MRSNTVSSLSGEERMLWEHFQRERTKEISDIVEGLADSSATSAIVWDEFLRNKWVTLTDKVHDPVSCIRFLRAIDADGPDLRAVQRRRHAHKALLYVPEVAPKPTISAESEKVKKGTLYNFFFKMRYQEAKEQGQGFSVRDLTRDIARQWHEMSGEDRNRLRELKAAWERKHEEPGPK